MLKKDREGRWRGSYVWFLHVPVEGRKTLCWDVMSDAGERLGGISWFARWRKYAFFPAHGSIYEEVCLREIAFFINERTTEHKLLGVKS